MPVVCPRKNAHQQPYNPGNPDELGQFNPQGPAFFLSDDPGLASKQTNYSVSRVGLIIGGAIGLGRVLDGNVTSLGSRT